jgi:hypothetical protein
MKVGDRVKIDDFSEAHGDLGTVYRIQSNGIIAIVLDENEADDVQSETLWVVMSEDDLMPLRTIVGNNKNLVVTYDHSENVANKVLDYLIENYYLKHESFCGESIQQCDNTILDAPAVLSGIADKIIKFHVDYKEDDLCL